MSKKDKYIEYLENETEQLQNAVDSLRDQLTQLESDMLDSIAVLFKSLGFEFAMLDDAP